MKGGKSLHSEEHGDFISITRDNVVFGMEISDFEKAFQKIKDKIIPYITEEILHKYKINRFQRLGVIFRYEFENKDISNQITKKVTGGKVKDPNEMFLQFSKKLPTLRGASTKGKDNYKNIIYKFETIDNKLGVEIDYQLYFTPNIFEASETNPKDFLDHAKKFNELEISNWLKIYTTKNG